MKGFDDRPNTTEIMRFVRYKKRIHCSEKECVCENERNRCLKGENADCQNIWNLVFCLSNGTV